MLRMSGCCDIINTVMKMEEKIPERKPTRIKNYDYSSVGAYFVTICTQDRKQILSEIIRKNNAPVSETNDYAVGDGAHCPESQRENANNTFDCETSNYAVGEGLAPPEYSVKLKPCGEIAAEQLKNLEKRYQNVTIEDYVIMPDHIHVIIIFHKQAGGASPSPTLIDVVCAFKSLCVRNCKQKYGIDNFFQRSFFDHIIRDNDDYETRRKYIHENPKRWYYKNI